MECIEGCGKGVCRKDGACPRVQAMADFIVAAHQGPPYTTTLPEVIGVGGITPDQWRTGYTIEESPCFKRAVERVLGGQIVYEQGGVGKNAVGVRRLTYLRRNYE